jgi:hypothetical protein
MAQEIGKPGQQTVNRGYGGGGEKPDIQSKNPQPLSSGLVGFNGSTVQRFNNPRRVVAALLRHSKTILAYSHPISASCYDKDNEGSYDQPWPRLTLPPANRNVLTVKLRDKTALPGPDWLPR